MHSQSHRLMLLALVTSYSFILLPTAYASPLMQLWTAEDASSPSSLSSTIKLARRSTSGVVHDKFFIPAVAAMGGVLLIALLCCVKLVQHPNRPDMPPGTRGSQLYHNRPPTVRLSQAQGDSRRQSKIQRKPAPSFIPSTIYTPSASEAGTDPHSHLNPSNTNAPHYPTHPIPGVPQHPSLAMYSPEPLPYIPMSVARSAAPPPDPVHSTSKGPVHFAGVPGSTVSSGQSSTTQVASENALSYMSYVSRNGTQYRNPNLVQGASGGNIATPNYNQHQPPRQERYHHGYLPPQEDPNYSGLDGKKSSESAAPPSYPEKAH